MIDQVAHHFTVGEPHPFWLVAGLIALVAIYVALLYYLERPSEPGEANEQDQSAIRDLARR